MRNNLLYRNARARDLLDIFLVSAISSLLLLRFYLYITGYPQLGGGPLHIAHMLYGGILMMVAIVLMLSFLGVRARQAAALIGGAGFGIFIDELGKFITADNDYFFHPTVGLIYAIFVLLYLVFNFLTRKQRLSSREYQINVLAELEEAVAANLDKTELNRIHTLLNASNQSSSITKNLNKLVDNLHVNASERPSKINKLFKKIDKQYKKFWEMRGSNAFVRLFFIAEVVVLSFGIFLAIYTSTDDIRAIFEGSVTYGEEMLIGQVVSSMIAAGFLIYGLSQLPKSRLEAFEQFKNAALVNIYLTQFFVFVRVQFAALPGLILNIVILLLISFVLREEIRLGGKNNAEYE